MPFAAALSEHPDAATAAGEAIGEVAERLGADVRADLAVLFVTAAHRGDFAQITGAVRELLAPTTLVGACAESVVGGAREVEEAPGIALWAAAGIGPVEPVRLDALRTDSGIVMAGVPEVVDDGERALLLVPDPFSFPIDALVEHLGNRSPHLRIIGGLASAASAPGQNLLVLDDAIHTDGAVGVLLGPDVAATTVVSQGCRPIGQPLTVTRSEGRLIWELAGQPALQRLQELAGSLDPADRELLATGIHLGRVIDEHKVDFSQGDFLIRAVVGADRESGAIAVGDDVEPGTTVQFQVRDAASADADLRAALSGAEADAALVFTCNGRGRRLFDEPHHDAATVSELTGSAATAGMFCAGEVGPVGGRNFIHGFTASLLLFRDQAGASSAQGAAG